MCAHCSMRPAQAVGLLVLLGWAVGLVSARDMARYLPVDTAVFIGWSQCQPPASPQLETQQKALAGLSAMLAARGEPDEGAALFVRWLGQVLPILQTGSAGIGLFDVVVERDALDIQVAMVVESPEARRLATLLQQLVEQLGLKVDSEQSVGGVKMQVVNLPVAHLRLLWGLREPVFIAALGDQAAAKVLATLTGDGATLAEAAELKLARQKLSAHLEGQHLCLYLDVQKIVTRGREVARDMLGGLPAVLDPLLEELGLNAVRAKYVHYERNPDGPRLLAFAHATGPARGLLKLFDQKPLTDEDLKIIPQDAYWASVYNLDLASLWEEVLRIVDALAPEQRPAIDGALAMTTPVLGFSIVDDLLPVFGDTWAVFDAPDHGGLLLSGTVLVAEVKDSQALEGMLERVAQLLAPLTAQGNVKLMLKKLQRGEHDIRYLLVGGAPVPLAPAWSFADGRWVFGLSPQTVATALRQIDPRTRGPSLLDRADFQAARAAWPARVQGVDYFDTRYFTRMLYPLVNGLRTLAVSVLAAHGMEIDLTTMPPLPESAAGMTNYIAALGRDDEGVVYVASGEMAPLSMLAATTALTASVVVPSLADARRSALRVRSMANLNQIGGACYAYAAEHDQEFPRSLRQLVEEGLVSVEIFQSPLDPETMAESYGYVAGQTSASPGDNVLIFEWPRERNATAVLFVDGHVEWLPLAEFKRRLIETYRRLGREQEIPVEFRSPPTRAPR